MNNTFLYDFFKLNDYKFQEWHENFYWPVSRDESDYIIRGVKRFQFDLSVKYGDTLKGNCSLISYILTTNLSKILNHYLCIKRLGNKHVEYSDRLKLIPLKKIISAFQLTL